MSCILWRRPAPQATVEEGWNSSADLPAYVNYVNENVGENAQVVFDSYPDKPTTKDANHLKRIKGKKGRIVKFPFNSKMLMSKEKFKQGK